MALAGELERALGERYGDLWFDPADLVLYVHGVIWSAVCAAQVGVRIQPDPLESGLVTAGGLPRALPQRRAPHRLH